MLQYKNADIEKVVQDMMRFEPVINISATSMSYVDDFITYLKYERAVLFHVDEVVYSFNRLRNVAELKPHYLYSKGEYSTIINNMKASVSALASGFRKYSLLYDREKAIHDYICSSVTYSEFDSSAHSIIGPLLNKKGVCDGISKTAKVLLQESGIESFIVYGQAKKDGLWFPHAWNIIKLGNDWFQTDFTLDNTISADSAVRYDYFNVTNGDLKSTHKPKKRFKEICEKCTCGDNYYTKTNSQFFNQSSFENYLITRELHDLSSIQVRLNFDITPENANKLYEKCLQKKLRLFTYRYSYNENLNVFLWSM